MKCWLCDENYNRRKVRPTKIKTDEIFTNKGGFLPISEKSKVGRFCSNLRKIHLKEFILKEVASFL